MIVMIGWFVVFFYYEDIYYFLRNVYGMINDLLKVVKYDFEEFLYFVGVKIFCLLLKFVIVLLWWFIESLGYILDMDINY